MNLGLIKRRARSLRGSTTASRWNDLLLLDHANAAQVQVSLDVDFPQSTQTFYTNPAPTVAPTLTLTTLPLPPSPTTLTYSGSAANVAADGSAATHVTIHNTALQSISGITLGVQLTPPVAPPGPIPSLSADYNNVTLVGTQVDFDLIVSGGAPGQVCTISYSVQGN